MKYNMKLNVLVMVVLALVNGSSWAAKSDVKVLYDFVANFSSLSANFIQTQPDEALFSENKSSGYVLIQRPGKLRWVYQNPEQQEIIVDGRNLWVYEPELDQVTVRPLRELQADFPLRWLLYAVDLKQHFTVIAGEQVNDVAWFNLVPKEGSSFFQSIDVAIEQGQLKQIWMYQSLDTVTKVRLLDLVPGVRWGEDEFEFVPPRGVDVLGQPQ